MSESFLIAGILSISGGLQDAYTYMYRGKVFANGPWRFGIFPRFCSSRWE